MSRIRIAAAVVSLLIAALCIFRGTMVERPHGAPPARVVAVP